MQCVRKYILAYVFNAIDYSAKEEEDDEEEEEISLPIKWLTTDQTTCWLEWVQWYQKYAKQEL